MNEVFGRMLEIMKSDGLTQVQMAKILGISNATVSHLINGRNNPGLDLIRNFSAEYIAVDLNWLLMGKGKKFLSESFDSSGGFGKNQDTDRSNSAAGSKVILLKEDGSFEEFEAKK